MRNSLAARSLRFSASLVLGLLVGRTGLAVDAPSYARHVEQWGVQELILRSAPGHLLWWSVGGELVGEAPARLRFLRRIMLEAPYTEMEPASGLVNDGTPLVIALAKPGSYYLFHFAQAKEASDWNIGSFGPATPSNPLPLKPLRFAEFKRPPIPEFHVGEGIFRVDMIDTWNMKVYCLGYTSGPTQKFQPQLSPGLMRFVKVDHAEPGQPAGSVAELMDQFGSRPRPSH